MRKIAIGNDHAGTELKFHLLDYLKSNHFEITNFGTDETDSVDYPDLSHKVADALSQGRVDVGILICGSGNGVAITANKYKNIRAALCWTPKLAALARQHNNANILCLPARFISTEEGIEILKSFMNSDFEGGRHQRRIEKI